MIIVFLKRNSWKGVQFRLEISTKNYKPHHMAQKLILINLLGLLLFITAITKLAQKIDYKIRLFYTGVTLT